MARPRLYPTEAIALKRMDFGEADRIITVFTPHYGKLRLLAKGVRRTTSRMAGHLEPFAHAHIMVARGRDLDLATQASTIEPFRAIRDSLVNSSHAYHLAELVDGFLQDGDEHQEVFALLRAALAGLASDDIPPELVTRHFEVHLLGAVGFRPQLSLCVSCDISISPGANGYSAMRGGVFCAACARQESSASPILPDTLKLLRFLQRTASPRELGIRVPKAVLQDAEGVLRRHVEFVLERRLRAADFVRHLGESAEGHRA